MTAIRDIGITDQVKDDRIGYDAPEIWPWVQHDGKEETGAAKAATTIDAQGTVEGWPPVDPKAWIRVSTDGQ